MAAGQKGTFVNELMPGEAQVAEMQRPGPKDDGPIVMVNLLKFKEKAEYADGRDTDFSGRKAYQLYAMKAAELVYKHGGQIIYAGDTSFLTLGQCDPLWDEVALAYYPNRKALYAMSISPEWGDISVHRAAGLAGQLNIETTPAFLPPAFVAGGA
ncbi:MAG: DUF1330 domain-containing protein [Pseudomonadota bacterium]